MSRQGGKWRPSQGVDPCAVFGGQALDSDSSLKEGGDEVALSTSSDMLL